MASEKNIPLYFGLFLISLTTLLSELLFIRIISVIFFVVLVYFVIGLTLLGFGAAGAFLAVWPGLVEKNFDRRITWTALAFTLSTPVVYAVTIALCPFAQGKVLYLLYFFGICLIMTIHFFLGGLVIISVFTRRREEIPRLYSINLVGSGLACLALATLISPLGGEKLIMAVTLLGALGALAFSLRSSKAFSAAAAVLAAVVLLAMPVSDRIFKIIPSKYGKQLGWLINLKPDAEIEYAKWDPVARVEVSSAPDEYIYMPEKLPFKFATQDGSAGTFIVGFDRDYSEVDFTDHTGLGSTYWLKEEPEVLVIGVGGGIDIMAALHYHARKVTGVEINKRMIEAVQGPYAEFTRNLYDRDEVEIVHAEGRCYTRRSKDLYDIIVMTGVDTVTAQSIGNYVMAENYLYTVEAFQDFLAHLKDDGIFSVTRFWVERTKPRTTLRMCAIGVEAMRRLGIERPEEHFFVQGRGIFIKTLMKKSPFTPEEIRTMEEKIEAFPYPEGLTMVPLIRDIYPARMEEETVVYYRPDDFPDNPFTSDNPFASYFKAVSEGRDPEFVDAYPYNISPCTDDSPFFWTTDRWNLIEAWKRGEQPVSLLAVLFYLAILTLLTLVMILFPLYRFRKKGLKARGSLACILYFLCLGVGYMFIEIAFIQKFTLFLGHPTYSLSVVIFAMLIFSGLGSLTSGRLRAGPKGIILGSVLVTSALTLLYLFVLDPLFFRLLPQGITAKIFISVLVLSPVAFVMGMPFPTGLRVIERSAVDFVPWAWGINGSASVLSTVVAAIIATVSGFSVVLTFAVAVYLVGMVAITAGYINRISN